MQQIKYTSNQKNVMFTSLKCRIVALTAFGQDRRIQGGSDKPRGPSQTLAINTAITRGGPAEDDAHV